MKKVVVYGTGVRGHRAEYYALLDAELRALGFVPEFTSEPRRLLAARRTFFAMIDENLALFVLCALATLLPGRLVAGLFFRAGECFDSSPKHVLKLRVFRFLRSLPKVRVLTILPFFVSERFAEVALGWIYDPQLWDLETIGRTKLTAETALWKDIRNRADKRRIIVALGAQNTSKGFDYLADIWASIPEFRESFLVVVAGNVAHTSRSRVQPLIESGAIVINRFVTQEEMASLYEVADFIWGAYDPRYDQASGIIGRAFQLNRPSIVRRGSYMARLMAELGGRYIEIDFNEASGAAREITDRASALEDTGPATDMVRSMRLHSLQTIAEALTS